MKPGYDQSTIFRADGTFAPLSPLVSALDAVQRTPGISAMPPT